MGDVKNQTWKSGTLYSKGGGGHCQSHFLSDTSQQVKQIENFFSWFLFPFKSIKGVPYWGEGHWK